MTEWTQGFRRGWRGRAQVSSTFSVGFAVACLILATAVRWGLSLIRPDVPFTPYIPAVFFATAFGTLRTGVATAVGGGVLAFLLDFGDAPTGTSQLALLIIYLAVSGVAIWGIEHYRNIVAHHRHITERLLQEERYRKLIVDELQHRLKNKVSTIHAVLHQILHNQPQVWASVDQRVRSLSATDDLIARADNKGCDLKELLLSELSPYGHVRFMLNGNPLFLPAKLAVSLALIFHELATNAGKYGAFASPRGMLNVSWAVNDDRRLTVNWDETEGPPIGAVGDAGFGTKLLKIALRPFNGGAEISYLKTGMHCTLQCDVPNA